MPLSLGQIKVGAVVDHVVRWIKKEGTDREHEVPNREIKRGMIVRVDGDSSQEKVEGVYVTFGTAAGGKDRFEYNGVTLPCVKMEPRELNLLWDSQDRRAREAWNRTFRVAEDVGQTFESRTAKQGKPKIVDSLSLTGAPAKGPISDNPPAPALKGAQAEEKD